VSISRVGANPNKPSVYGVARGDAASSEAEASREKGREAQTSSIEIRNGPRTTSNCCLPRTACSAPRHHVVALAVDGLSDRWTSGSWARRSSGCPLSLPRPQCGSGPTDGSPPPPCFLVVVHTNNAVAMATAGASPAAQADRRLGGSAERQRCWSAPAPSAWRWRRVPCARARRSRTVSRTGSPAADGLAPALVLDRVQ
jgi:hypothetical protein